MERDVLKRSRESFGSRRQRDERLSAAYAAQSVRAPRLRPATQVIEFSRALGVAASTFYKCAQDRRPRRPAKRRRELNSDVEVRACFDALGAARGATSSPRSARRSRRPVGAHRGDPTKTVKVLHGPPGRSSGPARPSGAGA